MTDKVFAFGLLKFSLLYQTVLGNVLSHFPPCPPFSSLDSKMKQLTWLRKRLKAIKTGIMIRFKRMKHEKEIS